MIIATIILILCRHASRLITQASIQPKNICSYDQVAASMGYYWREDGWDEEALCNAGFPIGLLPQVLLDLMWGYLGIWLGCLGFG